MQETIDRTEVIQVGQRAWQVEYIGAQTGRVAWSPVLPTRERAELHAKAQLGARMS